MDEELRQRRPVPDPGKPTRQTKPEPKRLRAQPRGKGNRGERGIVDLFHRFGYEKARRNFQSGGQGGGDIINGPPDLHTEVKYQERCSIWKWLAQAAGEARATDNPAVFFRRNRSPWYVAVEAEHYMELRAELEILRERSRELRGDDDLSGDTERAA